MRARHAVAAVAAGSLIPLACGSFGESASQNAAEVTPDAAETPEQRTNEFACGPASCTVGRDVCCLVNGGAACAPAQRGCASAPAADGGTADAGPVPQALSCVTYRNCADEQDCCWSAATGAVCADECAADELPLCRDGDGCGSGRSCERIDDSPLPSDFRVCRRDQGGGGSNGGFGGGRGGFGGGGFP